MILVEQMRKIQLIKLELYAMNFRIKTTYGVIIDIPIEDASELSVKKINEEKIIMKRSDEKIFVLKELKKPAKSTQLGAGPTAKQNCR